MKTKGSVDKVFRRKKRKDKGKRRKFYAGRPVKKKRLKHGRFVPYESKRKRYDPIKIWWWERRRMSYSGYLRWSRKLRKHIVKTVTYFVDKPFYVDPEHISTPEKIGDLAIDTIQYPGVFLLMMPTHSKNSYHVSFKKKAVVRLYEVDGELYAKVSSYSQMSRYWFFKS